MRKEENNKDGLYKKYQVKKYDTGEDVDGCFVLRLKDEHARRAIETYAEEVDNEILSRQLLRWVKEWEEYKCVDLSKGYCEKVSSPVCCLHCVMYQECLMDGDIKCYLAMGEISSKEECENSIVI